MRGVDNKGVPRKVFFEVWNSYTLTVIVVLQLHVFVKTCRTVY